MESFYIIVLTFAVIAFIIVLTVIGLLMRKGKETSTIYPPLSNTCPDFWKIASDGKTCTIPLKGQSNVGNLYNTEGTVQLQKTNSSASYYTPGLSGNSTVDFADIAWSSLGKASVCAQNSWANSLNIQWDGVSNYNSC
jgi:hypothetical protein